MGLPWFRVYSEFATDPKIQSMCETSQRRFVMLLCLKCDGCVSQLTDEEVACALRIGVEEALKTKELFIKKGFITDNWDVVNWDKRQYKSDSSKERTKAWREKQKCDAKKTSQKRHRDGNETPPDTDTDTDIKKNIKKKKLEIIVPECIDSVLWEEFRTHRTEIKKPMTPTAEKKALKSLVEFNSQGYNTSKIIEHAIAHSWQGIFLPKDMKPEQKRNEPQYNPYAPGAKRFADE